MKKENLKIVYLGNPDIAATVLEKLAKDGFHIEAVFCSPDKKAGRGNKTSIPPVKTSALRLQIPVFQPYNKVELTEDIKKLSPDLMIVFAFGMFLPKEAFDFPKYKTINIHPSLLPKYRGPSPIIEPILNGEKETGISIIKISDKMDAGEIIYQEKVAIESQENSQTLGEKLALKASEILPKLIQEIIEQDTYSKKQNEAEATFTKIYKKGDGKIDWNEEANIIERKIRAFIPWPGSYTIWDRGGKEMILKIHKAAVINIKGTPGKVSQSNSRLLVGTGNESLAIEELQLEGKKVLKAWEFLRGYPDIIGNYLK